MGISSASLWHLGVACPEPQHRYLETNETLCLLVTPLVREPDHRGSGIFRSQDEGSPGVLAVRDGCHLCRQHPLAGNQTGKALVSLCRVSLPAIPGRLGQRGQVVPWVTSHETVLPERSWQVPFFARPQGLKEECQGVRSAGRTDPWTFSLRRLLPRCSQTTGVPGCAQWFPFSGAAIKGKPGRTSGWDWPAGTPFFSLWSLGAELTGGREQWAPLQPCAS